MPEQTHFSLMGELLDPDITPHEQVVALVNHANKEFSLALRQSRAGSTSPLAIWIGRTSGTILAPRCCLRSVGSLPAE
jgi:hypothetical protein